MVSDGQAAGGPEAATSGQPALEPPDGADSDFHFAECDPSRRFGRVRLHAALPPQHALPDCMRQSRRVITRSQGPVSAGGRACTAAPPPLQLRARLQTRLDALTGTAPPRPPPSALQFDQVLGRGAFKVVYKAFDTQEGAFRQWRRHSCWAER